MAAPAKLGPAARRAIHEIELGRAVGWIPAAVAAEVVLLCQLGRTTVGLPQVRHVLAQGAHMRYSPLDLDQLDEFAALGGIRDPFDRLIIAAARKLDASLITRDTGITGSGLVQIVWA